MNTTVTQVDIEKIKHWSLFVEKELARFPELSAPSCWQASYQPGELIEKLFGSLTSASDLVELNDRLRRHRIQEMVRVAIRDLSGTAPLEDVLRDLSDLAEGLVSGALEWHYRNACERYGVPTGADSGLPQKMLVIGMGKLGGRELNFSSDIDLIFAYPEKGYAINESGKETPNDQFFIRLGQALNKSLTEYTDLGMVYRVDMRLRPFGDSGPLAVSFAELENYYELHGRAWERYALVKARVIAGDKEAGRQLFDILRPFVYRKYVDFTAIESLRELKMMINAEVQKKDKLHNIKLGRGGIREVEFITQAFQLIHGGKDIDLQGRELMPMLKLLVEKQFLQAEVVDQLLEAYRFLRIAENRLQEWNDQQTHDLPELEGQRAALAASMGFDSYDAFNDKLQVYLNFVQAEFDSVFAQNAEEVEIEEDADSVVAKEVSLEDLERFELDQPEAILKQIKQFKSQRAYTHASGEALTRFRAVLPKILTGLKSVDNQEVALERVLRVVESVIRRSVYLVLLKENPSVIRDLLKLCSLSAWMADMLVKYPALLDQLLDERVLYEPLALVDLQQEAYDILGKTQGDEEAFMNQLRQWKHEQVFKVAAADVTGNVPVMKVSDYLTWIAEAVVEVVTQYAWRLMQVKNGLPGGVSSPDDLPFLILGYGKLGGIELGYGSDLDMVFLYYGLDSSAMSSGERALENNVYFIRMGQKIISLMTTMMPTGVLYEVDSRLRPNGASGLLVTGFDHFSAYQQNKAWTWEHQALVRARPVAGSEAAREGFWIFKREFIARRRPLDALKGEVVDMRNKMRASLDKSNADQFDLKQGRGGIVDIEFLVQYLVLGYSHQYASLLEWTDNIRLLEALKETEILTHSEVDALENAYRQYRKQYHRLALQNVKSVVAADAFVDTRQAVSSIWDKVMEA